MKSRLFKKKMGAKTHLMIKLSGVSIAENAVQGTMAGGATGALCGYVTM